MEDETTLVTALNNPYLAKLVIDQHGIIDLYTSTGRRIPFGISAGQFRTILSELPTDLREVMNSQDAWKIELETRELPIRIRLMMRVPFTDTLIKISLKLEGRELGHTTVYFSLDEILDKLAEDE